MWLKMISLIVLFKYDMLVVSGFPCFQMRHGQCVGGIDPENCMLEETRNTIMYMVNEGKPMHKRVGVDIFNCCSLKHAALWQRFKARDDFLQPGDGGFRRFLNKAHNKSKLKRLSDAVSTALDSFSSNHEIDPAYFMFEGELNELLKPRTGVLVFSWGTLESSALTREFIKKRLAGNDEDPPDCLQPRIRADHQRH